jgi:polyisoprenoid-binding protein YceI
MKKNTFCLLILLTSKLLSAQYKPVDMGSELKFKIGNFGFDVTGSFTGFQGSISFDAQNPSVDKFDVSIDAASVNTDNSLRDKHLKDESYFDVKDYPRIRLVSGKITVTNKTGVYLFTGQLTIRDKSKEVSFPFTAVPSGDGYLFKGLFKIHRKDFEVGGSSTISNELEVSLSVLAEKA